MLFNILKVYYIGKFICYFLYAILKVNDVLYHFLYDIFITISYKGLLNCIWLSLDSKDLSTKVVWEPWWAWGYSMLAYITNTNNYQPNDGYGVVKKDSHMQHQGHPATLPSPCSSSLIAVRDTTLSRTKGYNIKSVLIFIKAIFHSNLLILL